MSHDPAAMIIFDDGRAHLGPMADLRATFEIRSGMQTTAGRIALAYPRTLAGYWVPPRLVRLVARRANAPVNLLPSDECILCINGRLALPDSIALPELGEAVVEEGTGDVIAARLRRADAEYFLQRGELGERIRQRTSDGRLLYRYPWDVIALLESALRHDLQAVVLPDSQIARQVATVIGDHAIGIDPAAKVLPGVIFDAEAGPIHIGPRAVLRPGAVIIGPAAVLGDSVVLDRAVIRAGSVIGPSCKVAGEISMTVFQGRANKAHEGFVGHSWIGKWANLGAGTTTSNLLNTYGQVSMRIEAAGAHARTGQTFLGTIFGDHVKTAILTRLMTGTCIGTGAMIATTAAPPDTVGRFAWLTDDGLRVFRLERFLETMHTVLQRRGLTADSAYIEAIVALHQGVQSS